MAKTQRLMIIISAYLMTIAGLAILIFGICLHFQQVFNYQFSLYQQNPNYIEFLIKYSIILLGGLILIVGISGIMAFRIGNCCSNFFLFIYLFGALFLFLLFTGLSILLIMYSNKIVDQTCDSLEYSKKVESQFQQASELFCSESCRCYISQSNIEEYPERFKGTVYTSDDQDEKKIIKVQSCLEYKVDLYTAVASIMGLVERLFDCTGWCSSFPYFIFSDINSNFISGLTCFEETQNYIEKNSALLSYIFVELSFLYGLNVIFSFGFFCKPKKHIKDKLDAEDSKDVDDNEQSHLDSDDNKHSLLD